MITYLAGPMSGKPQYNYPLFLEAAEKMREAGWRIINPAEMDKEEVFEESMAAEETKVLGMGDTVAGHTWGDFLSRDVKLIADSDIDSIMLLPEWETSKGARLEVFVCMNLGYPVYFYNDGDPQQLNYERVFADIMESVLL